jgi:hypothetical protein
MAKKQVDVSLRKPPPADPDAFVASADKQAAASLTRCEHASEGPTVVTRVGERREVTVYLPTALARQLSVRCVELDRDVSHVVAEAIAKTLSIEEEAPPMAFNAAPIADRWARARGVFAQVRARLPLGLGLA